MSSERKKRAGHRVYVKNLLPEVDECLVSYDSGTKAELLKWQATLKEQLEKILPLDAVILDQLVANEKANEKDVADEGEQSGRLKADLAFRLASIEEKLAGGQPQLSFPQQHETAPKKTVRTKLPKLEVPKFNGKLHEWQEFLDSYRGAIHQNDSLEEVDKFTYLRSLLTGQAKSAIAGFALTSANYGAAVELLTKRYGKKTAIQRAHVNDMLTVSPVYNERDLPRLRTLYDLLETKFRALQALGVHESSYSAIVVPSVLEKLPQPLRLTITRGKDHEEWKMSDLLENQGGEIELWEQYSDSSNTAGDFRKRNILPKRTLFAGKEKNCAFCLGPHKHEDCQKIRDVKERSSLLLKYGRCYNCLAKGHLSGDCTVLNVVCGNCKGKHHSAICNNPQGNLGSSETQGTQGSGGPVGNSMHVGTGNSVALQTAQAQIVGKEPRELEYFMTPLDINHLLPHA